MKAAATRMVLLVALSFQPLQLCPCYYCRASPVDDANNFFEEEEYDDDFFPLIIDASNVERRPFRLHVRPRRPPSGAIERLSS